MLSVALFMSCNTSLILLVLTVEHTSLTYLCHSLMSLLAATSLFSRSCITASVRKLERSDLIVVPDTCL